MVAAGSLLEFLLEEDPSSSRCRWVASTSYTSAPMTFLEFLLALGEDELVEQLQTLDPKYWALSHDVLVQKLRAYFFCWRDARESGATYVQSKSTLEVSRVHASLLQTYKADFAKYKTRIGFEPLARIFDKLPVSLGQKVKYASLLPDEKSKSVFKVLESLREGEGLDQVRT